MVYGHVTSTSLCQRQKLCVPELYVSFLSGTLALEMCPEGQPKSISA